MDKKKCKNCKDGVEECLESAVSANECTGALQHVFIDVEEVAEFHKKYNS